MSKLVLILYHIMLVYCLSKCECLAYNFLECRYVWESNANGGYAISEDTQGEPLGRGTQIKLFLKVLFQAYLLPYIGSAATVLCLSACRVSLFYGSELCPALDCSNAVHTRLW